MEISPSAAGVPEGVVTLQKALAHPKVTSFANLLKIDLSNEAQRAAVLSQAARNLEMADLHAVAQPGGGAAPHPVITRQYVEKALQAYREIAAL